MTGHMLHNQATGATVWHHPVTLLVDWIRLRRSNKPSTPMATHTQVTEATKWDNEVVYVPWDSEVRAMLQPANVQNVAFQYLPYLAHRWLRQRVPTSPKALFATLRSCLIQLLTKRSKSVHTDPRRGALPQGHTRRTWPWC